ncbi:MAG TPA: hypothetical protein VHP58_06345 [Alphaproteobacteria bacterium]|nr:hypothetical protein [Alphaproteobacteria bacterium]
MLAKLVLKSIESFYFALTVICGALFFDLMVHFILWLHGRPDHLLQQLIDGLQKVDDSLLFVMVMPVAALIVLATTYLTGRAMHAAGLSAGSVNPPVSVWVFVSQVLAAVGLFATAVAFSHVFLWQGEWKVWLAGQLYILALTLPLKVLHDAFTARPFLLDLSSGPKSLAA